MTENELAKIAVNICYQIHTTLGSGLLETAYEEAFAYELDELGIDYLRQHKIPIRYKKKILDVGFFADFILERKLLIQIKSVQQLEKVDHKTVLTYMKLTGIKLGLLVNFNENLIKDGIHRKIYGNL